MNEESIRILVAGGGPDSYFDGAFKERFPRDPGFRFDDAKTGVESLHQLEKINYPLVIVDSRMAPGNGFPRSFNGSYERVSVNLISLMRDYEQYSKTPLIVFGPFFECERCDYFDAGATSHYDSIDRSLKSTNIMEFPNFLQRQLENPLGRIEL